jgi:hypothetical protein
MKSKFIFFFLFIQCSFMSAQTLTIHTAEVCAGQEVLLPVTGESLLNVAALTLYIGFDTTNLSFVSIENIDPQLTGMSANMMSAPSQLAFAWSNTIPVNFLNGKMFDLKFITNGLSAPVFFNPGCEIADPSGTALPVVYTNGAINSGLPLVSIQPKDTAITEGGHAMFSVFSPNAISCFWRESQDHGTSWLTLEDGGIYSGTHSEELTLSPVPLSFDKNLYQCVLTRENCLAVSVPVTLVVDALTSNENLLNPGHKNILISPVPFYDHTSIEFTMPENGNATIQVMSCLGQIVSEIALPSQHQGHHHILLNTSDWRPGVYFVKFSLISANEKSNQVVKIIKNT